MRILNRSKLAQVDQEDNLVPGQDTYQAYILTCQSCGTKHEHSHPNTTGNLVCKNAKCKSQDLDYGSIKDLVR